MADFVQDVWEAADDGLPHPGVVTIIQDRRGYLWIGTFAGLVRFDGIEFQRPDAPAIPALTDHVRLLMEASDGALWIGTRREGAVRLKDGKAEILSTKEGLSHDEIRGLAQTPDGKIWIATITNVYARDASGRLRTYDRRDGLPLGNLSSMYTDADGTLWIGAGQFGLVRFDGTRFQTIPLPVPEGSTAVSPAVGINMRAVVGLTRDRDGVLWAGTSLGLIRVPEKNEPGPLFIESGTGAITGLRASPRGGVWVSTGSGLAFYRDGDVRKYLSRDGLVHESLTCAYEDAEGSLWLCTRVGLARLRPRVVQAHTERSGFVSDLATSVLQSRDGAIWAGHRLGVSRFQNGRWSTLGRAEGLPSESVRSLAEGPDGSMWIGTVDGLAQYKNGRFTVYRTAETPYSQRSLTFDAQGRLWLATPYGLDVLENGKLRRAAVRSKLCDTSTVNVVFAARDGTIWVGGASGLAKFRDGEIECLRDPAANARNDIRFITEDDEGAIWLGTIGGMARLKNGVRETFAGSAGPFNTTVYSFLDDDRGSLWCNTAKGLFQVDKKNLHLYAQAGSEQRIFRVFGSADGMETAVGAGDGTPPAWRARDGRLWFTTVTGLAVVDPSRIEVNTKPPAVYIERALGDRNPVDMQGHAVRLPAGTRDLELHFAVLSFIAPEKSQYKYRLEGFDQGWIASGGRRVAYYTNVPPGRYRFRVVAANHNGIWNEEGAALDVELLPRFYETRWFAPLCIALLLAGATALYRLRIARMHANEAELQRRVAEEVAKVEVLSGMLPICASCRRVREDSGYWRQIEAYVMEHTSAKFSHGVCPECWENMRAEHPDLPMYQRGN